MKNKIPNKKEIMLRCRQAKFCKEEYQKLASAKNIDDFWIVLLSNYRWCIQNEIFSPNERPAKIVLLFQNYQTK